MNAVTAKTPWDRIQGAVGLGGNDLPKPFERPNNIVHQHRTKGNRMETIIAAVLSQDLPILLKFSTDPVGTLARHSRYLAVNEMLYCTDQVGIALSEFIDFLQEEYNLVETAPKMKPKNAAWHPEVACAFFEAFGRKLSFLDEAPPFQKWLKHVVQAYKCHLDTTELCDA